MAALRKVGCPVISVIHGNGKVQLGTSISSVLEVRLAISFYFDAVIGLQVEGVT